MNVSRGVRALHRLLAEHTVDLRGLDLPGFRRWLADQVDGWQADAVFVQRCRIRDLRRSHTDLLGLEKAYRRAVSADAAAPQFARLRELETERVNTAKAIAGLTAALARAGPEKRVALQEKLQTFRNRQEALREELDRLIRTSLPRQDLLRATAALQELRSVIGLDHEETHLAQLLRQRGHHSGRTGQAFERQALALTQSSIIPDLQPRSTAAAKRFHVLTGVTLGAAQIEFDQLVIRLPHDRDRPVEVLAVVEAKRNINDLAHGFRQRQENLAWLTGDTAHYEPARYRTGYFRSGHFDRVAIHQEGGDSFRFGPGSFRRFRRDPATGLFLERLYLITRVGTLWGLSSAALSRVSHRVATDECWQPDRDAYLLPFLHWYQSLAEPIETPDLLHIYSSCPKRGRQVVIVGR